MLAQLPPRVVQGLVERSACRLEPFGKHVDRHAVQRQRDEDAALMVGQHLVDRLLQGRQQLTLLGRSVGLQAALENRPQLSGSSGTSRPCHARFRNLTAASSSPNL